MRKVFTLILLLIAAISAKAQVSLTAAGYTQNFDALATSGTSNTWTDNSTIAGWYSNRTVYIGDNGNSNTGALFSYGATSSSERALGAITSGTTGTVQFAVRLVNNTGSTISGVNLSFRGEQWRQTANAQTLVFASQVNATSITSGTWTANTAFDFTSPQTGTAGALNGNASPNFTNISGTLNVTVANGSELWLRWTKTGTTSPGIAIDSFAVTPVVPLSSDANLSGLSLSSGSLSPAFDSLTYSYSASVSNSVSSVNVTPTGATTTSTIKVNGTTVASGSSTAVSLAVGSNTITTFVKAQDSIATKTYTVTVTRAAATTPTLIASALTSFGNVCINTTAGPNSFTLDGSNLDGTAVTIGSLAGFSYSTTATGTYTSTLNLSYSGTGFTGMPVYVKFSPTAVQSYNGNISVGGGGTTSAITVAAAGSGVNTGATVNTGGYAITGVTTTVSGSITVAGCAAVTAYGIEYSPNSGFVNGTGTQATSSNLSGGAFSVNLTGLTANRRYYYKAFATSSAGTVYGAQQAFNAPPVPVVLSAQSGLSFTEEFTDIANWGNFFVGGTGSEHFSQVTQNTSGTIPNPTTVTNNTVFSTGTSGGIQRGTDQSPALQSIVMLSTGATDNTSSSAFDFFMDFTGVNAGTLSFNYQTLNNSTGNRNSSLRVYAATDSVTFTEITNVLNFTNNSPISGSKVNIALPSSFDNSATARLRFYFYNGTGGSTGSRPKISIDSLTVTAVATSPCTTPTAPATSLVFGTPTDTTISASFTASTSGADQYLVVMSTNSSLTSNPVNGQIYNLGDNVGDGSVVAKGSSTSFTATGLTASTIYYFFIFPANAVCTGGPLYDTTSVLTGQDTTVAGLPPCASPSVQPSNLVFGTTTSNSIQGSFTGSAANEYIVVRSTSATLSANPVAGHVYNKNDIIGNGTVIARGIDTSFTAAGLAPSTLYYFFVFSINSQACVNGPAYDTVLPLSASQSTMSLPACTAPSAQPSSLTFKASNNAISGAYASGTGADSYLIVRSTSSSLSSSPVNNTVYTAGNSLGGGTVVASGTGNSFLATGLTAGTTYYFFIFSADANCSGGVKYLTTSPLTGSISTLNTTGNNYYFGTLHSHSDYSDGNQDNPGYTPANDYAYAMTAQCMDYLGISEHNHFSTADNPGNTITNYHKGITQADTFSAAHANFLALYGMEWGVISGGGHVVVYGDGMNNLFGWESGSGGWGSTNNYDVYVAKNDYTGTNGLFKTINSFAANNTFATLAHPNLTDYNNLANSAYNAAADSAITGVAVESGPASSTNTSYSNPGSSLSYLWYYQMLLAKGYHLGPTVDHDNHKTTFGKTTYSRTAIVAPSLSKANIISAMHDMHFYATQDCDTKVDFTINTQTMGSIFTDRFAPIISVKLMDATTSTSNAVIRLMYGRPGSGVTAVKLDSVIGNSFIYTDNALANLATGYYYADITNGTARMVTSPVWYTRNDNLIVTLPVKLTDFSAVKQEQAVKLNWTTAEEVATKEFVIERSADGVSFQGIGTVAAAGNASTPVNYSFTDNQPVNGFNFYRLRMVDKDEKAALSNVVKVIFGNVYSFAVSPNPASSTLFITASRIDDQTSLQLINATGQIVKVQTLASLYNTIDVSRLSKGSYIVKIINTSGVFTQKVIIR